MFYFEDTTEPVINEDSDPSTFNVREDSQTSPADQEHDLQANLQRLERICRLL